MPTDEVGSAAPPSSAGSWVGDFFSGAGDLLKSYYQVRLESKSYKPQLVSSYPSAPAPINVTVEGSSGMDLRSLPWGPIAIGGAALVAVFLLIRRKR